MVDLSGYRLTFSDEFNTRSIGQNTVNTRWSDIRSEWRFDANSDIGFGKSSFVDKASGYDPFRVQDGILTITATPDQTKYGYPGSWESGLITTQGGFSQTYGYFEMRADLSDSKGSWDAFWLLPDKQIPNSSSPGLWQEIDIVEHYGTNDIGVYSAIHTTDRSKQDYSSTQSYWTVAEAKGFHTYGLLWTNETISFYLDGKLTATKATPTDMHGPMYILANLAVERDAVVGDTPMMMQIDYIKAYALQPSVTAQPVTPLVTASDTALPTLVDPIPTHVTASTPVQALVPLPVEVKPVSATAVIIPQEPVSTATMPPTSPGLTIGASTTPTATDGATSSMATVINADAISTQLGTNGDDILIAVGSHSTLIGKDGNDTFLVNNLADNIIEKNGGGVDIVYSTMSYNLGDNEIEAMSFALQTSTANINLIGNFVSQTIVGNYGDNVLNGGSGSDTLIGLFGNDTYVVGDSRIIIQELDGQGVDTIITSVNYTIEKGISIESLVVQDRSSTGAVALIGNEFAQTLGGSEGENVIDGGLGADVLIGFGGADAFEFTTSLGAGNVDTISDFQSGIDKIALSSIVFDALGSKIEASEFVNGSAATADQHILYNARSGEIFYDADGSGSGSAVLFAVVVPGQALTNADFIIIPPTPNMT